VVNGCFEEDGAMEQEHSTDESTRMNGRVLADMAIRRHLVQFPKHIVHGEGWVYDATKLSQGSRAVFGRRTAHAGTTRIQELATQLGGFDAIQASA
jgi:hypothetical protein